MRNGVDHVEDATTAQAVADGRRTRAGQATRRDDDELLRIPEVAADWLKCSTRQVYNFIAGDRPLPVRRYGEKMLRVRVGDLRAWINGEPVRGL